MPSSGSPSGNTTTNTTTTPWSGQQPSLENQFGTANSLFYGPSTTSSNGTTTQGAFGQGSYDPTYFPGSAAASAQGINNTTVTPFNSTETSGLNQIDNENTNTTDYLANAAGTSNQMLQSGFLSSNPGSGMYSAASGESMNNPAMGMFGGLTQAAMANPESGGLNSLAGAAMANPTEGTLANTSANLATNATGVNPASGYLNSSAQAGQEGQSSLAQYANGSMLGAANPAQQQLNSSVLASAIPAAESQFISGGAMDGPAAEYAASNGAAAALAPYAEQNYNTQTTNQVNAANSLTNAGLTGSSTLGNQFLSGTATGLSGLGTAGGLYNTGISNATNALGTAGSLYNSGVGNAIGATQGLSGAYQSGITDQLQAAQGVSGNYNTLAGLQGQQAANAGTLANAMTTNSQVPFQVGQAEQTQAQNELTAQMQNYNYTQNLPLNMLNAYAGAISGNYGSSGSLTQPYYSNTIGNILGSGSSLAGIGQGLFG